MANLKKNDYTNSENLKTAFNLFDDDKDGLISIAELKRVFLGAKEEAIISAAISQTDSNNNGKVLILFKIDYVP